MSRFQVLPDAQWSLIEEMLPRPTGTFLDARTIVEAIIYRYRYGIAWRDFPRCSVHGRRRGPGITGWRSTAPGTR